jgi:hypothetical protein
VYKRLSKRGQQRARNGAVGCLKLEDARSSTKRLSKERLGWRCAGAWELRRGQRRVEGAAVVVERARRSRNRVVVVLAVAHCEASAGLGWRAGDGVQYRGLGGAE